MANKNSLKSFGVTCAVLLLTVQAIGTAQAIPVYAGGNGLIVYA